jgi:hypothetical protein
LAGLSDSSFVMNDLMRLPLGILTGVELSRQRGVASLKWRHFD